MQRDMGDGMIKGGHKGTRHLHDETNYGVNK